MIKKCFFITCKNLHRFETISSLRTVNLLTVCPSSPVRFLYGTFFIRALFIQWIMNFQIGNFQIISKYLFLQQIGNVMFNLGRLFLRQRFPTVWLCIHLRLFLHVHVNLANYYRIFLSPYLLQSLLIPLQSSKNSNVLVGFCSLTQFSKNSLNQGH